jgi:hypothetical protein
MIRGCGRKEGSITPPATYTRGGIPCYWIVNLVDRRIEVHSQPSGPTAVPTYASFQLYQPGDAVPLVLDGNTAGTVPVDELLPCHAAKLHPFYIYFPLKAHHSFTLTL